MSDQALAVHQEDLSATLMESVLLSGDLSRLKPEDRVSFYKAVCQSLNLNPLTKPFEYINLNGKLRLYATKDATEQLRKRDGIAIQIVARELVSEDVYVVTARAIDANGRTDESVGAVSVGGLKGENRANAFMKAETKAKRRVTLSICGLGILDGSETDSIPSAARIPVDDNGVIVAEVEDVPLEGSVEKREEVKNRKLAEIRTKPVVKEADNRGKGWYEIMIQGFSDIKEEIGSESYYRVLGANGYEHANTIPDRKTATKIYKEMAALRHLTEEEPVTP